MMLPEKFETIYNKPGKTPKEKFESIFRSVARHRPYAKLIPLVKRMIAVRPGSEHHLPLIPPPQFSPEKRTTNQDIELFF